MSDGVATYTPGTQTDGHSFGEGEPAGFVSYSSDTGGGWFGGHSGKNHNSGGSGGSVYVFTSTSQLVPGYQLDPKYQLTDTRLLAGDQPFPTTSDNNSEEVGHKGGGFVRITFIPKNN